MSMGRQLQRTCQADRAGKILAAAPSCLCVPKDSAYRHAACPSMGHVRYRVMTAFSEVVREEIRLLRGQ